MKRKFIISYLAVIALAACKGGETSGFGEIDYSSPTLVADLQTQLAALDPNIRVSKHGDGTIKISDGIQEILIEPGNNTASTIEVSGRLFDVNIDPSGKYRYSPSSISTSLDTYKNNIGLFYTDISKVKEKIGVDNRNQYVDLTVGTKNSSAKATPETVSLSGTAKIDLTGDIDGNRVIGSLTGTQKIKISHNLTDDTVAVAQGSGWDGTGVNITILDDDSPTKRYIINSAFKGTISASDGQNYEEQTFNELGSEYIYLSHSDLVHAAASGLEWKSAIEDYYGMTFNSDCSASSFTQIEDGLTFSATASVKSNHCGKIGIATGANINSIDFNTGTTYYDLIEQKNGTGKIEILNYSFGSSRYKDISGVEDRKNVLIVHAAGNDSQPNNGFDVYGDGRNVDGSPDVYELMDQSIINSDFSNNLIAVGALDANDNIAAYSTVAGPNYNGLSYAFLVEAGSINIEFDATTSISGNFSISSGRDTLQATINGTLAENLVISGQGTSYAAPRVSGKMAIASQKFPNLNAEQLVNLAKYTAIDLGQPGVDQIYGHGKINLTGMLSPIGNLK